MRETPPLNPTSEQQQPWVIVSTFHFGDGRPVLGAVLLDRVKLKLFLHVFLRHLPECVLVFSKQLEDCSELLPLNSETNTFKKHVETWETDSVRAILTEGPLWDQYR